MILSPDVMRFLLLLCLSSMAVLAVFFLRGRRLSYTEYIKWGLVIALVPLLGPFLAILMRPGDSRQ